MKKSSKTIVVVAISALFGMGFLGACSGSSSHDKEHHSSEHEDHKSGDGHHADTQGAYACPMHPEITGKAGDKCSKCGMKLIEMDHKADTHACPMHPEVTGKVGDECSKCGMSLTETDHKVGTHACPMHPEEKGMKGDKCSKCGMDMTEAEQDPDDGHGHDH